MDIKVLASGSSGNCYRIDNDQTAILIECGLPFRKLRSKLDFRLREIEGCLVSHGHKDHSYAVQDLIKQGIDCYMSQSTAKMIGANGHRLHIVRAGEGFEIGS